MKWEKKMVMGKKIPKNITCQLKVYFELCAKAEYPHRYKGTKVK